MVTNDYFLRRRRKNAMAYSEYWNPKNETLPREELQALQLLKLGRMCDWAYANSPFHHRKFDEAGFMPEQLKTLDDIRRIPFMTRDERADSYPRAGWHERLGVDRRDVVLWPVGLRHPPRRHHLFRLRLRLVHRVLGGPLWRGKNWFACYPWRGANQRGAHQADHRDGSNNCFLHPHLRADPLAKSERNGN